MGAELLVEQSGQAQEKTQTGKRTEQGLQQRPYLYELDQMRVLTILCMVAVHVLVYTAILTPDPVGIQVQNLVFNALRFTRTIFLFITAVALVFTYYGKPFSFAGF